MSIVYTLIASRGFTLSDKVSRFLLFNWTDLWQYALDKIIVASFSRMGAVMEGSFPISREAKVVTRSLSVTMAKQPGSRLETALRTASRALAVEINPLNNTD